MMCPPASELVQFTTGSLGPAEQHAIEVHLDVCAMCRTSVSELAREPRAPMQFGRYRIDGELGQGGMGIVLRGFDPQLARPVAIKVVRHADPEHRARLVREAQSLARLSHPNVCQIYDVGQDGEEVWFAMELIDGVTLRTWASGRSFDEILAALLAVAEGLAAAHDAGLVHRDVKPDNVLVDKRGRAVVTDFGLARFVAATDGATPPLTSTNMVFGSPGYMPPEQLSSAAVDARADQFAWAITAWEMLGAQPALPLDPTARLVAILGGLAPPAQLKPALGAVLVRALAAEPASRFPSFAELLRAVRSPVAPPSRKRGPLVGAVLGAAVVAVAGIAIVPGLLEDAPAAAAASTPPAPVPAPAPTPAPTPVPASTAPATDPMPAGYRRLAPLGPTNAVDPEAEWKRAYDEARREFSDALVDSLSVQSMTVDGTVDLGQGGMVITTFSSPSAHKRGAPQSMLTTSLGSTGGYISLGKFAGGRPIPWPRCTPRAIWQRVAKKTKLPAGGVADITYVSDPWGRPIWYFQLGTTKRDLRDDC